MLIFFPIVLMYLIVNTTLDLGNIWSNSQCKSLFFVCIYSLQAWYFLSEAAVALISVFKSLLEVVSLGIEVIFFSVLYFLTVIED